MKISGSMEIGVGNGLTYEQSARAMREAGYEGIDLNMCKHSDSPERLITDEWTEDVIMMADAAKAAGLEIAQSHMPYYPGHIDNPGDGSTQAFIDFMVPMYIHAIKAAKLIGCKTCVTHPFYHLGNREATIEGNAQVLKQVIPLLEETGISIAIENVFARRNGQYIPAYVEEADALMEMVRLAGSDNVGICLDTGHANIFRLNICEMARTFGSRLIALHINGNSGHDEHALPYATSEWCTRMDFTGLTKVLNEIGYKGFYNLEVTGGRFPASVVPMYYAYSAGVARWLADLK